MKVAAWSDGHGILPVIEDCDIVIIAGDIMPLNIQRDYESSIKWIKIEFFEYVSKLKCDKVFLVPGNHDFVFQKLPLGEMDKLIELYELKDKLIYLEDSLYEYNDLKIYGCPWCTGPFGWAFSPNDTLPDISSKYERIPDCDILLCHQPPKVGNLSTSYFGTAWQRDFGSDRLLKTIHQHKIGTVICGHIHSGQHGGVHEGETSFYNVSLKDEDYMVTYEPTNLVINK